MRRGLVIAGGGAKGAYSLGAMQALRERGYAFEAVAGTSAGALNAAIWATGDLDAGEKLWAGMSPENTYQRKWWLRILPRPLSRLMGAAGVVLSLCMARIAGSPINGKAEELIEAIIFFTLFLPVYILCVAAGNGLFASALPAILVATGVSMFLCNDDPGAQERNWTTAWVVAFGIACFVVHIPLELLFRWLPHVSDWTVLWTLPARLLLVLILTPVIAALLYLLSYPLFHIRVLTSEPLRRTLEAFLSTRPFRMPAYATVATQVHIFDPDDPTWVGVQDEQSEAFKLSPAGRIDAVTKGPWDPMASAKWVPRYQRLDEMPAVLAIEYLLASSALPFGVVSPVTIGDHSYVDGGVVDNLPILPLLDYELDEIFVLELIPYEAKVGQGDAYIRHCADLRRLQLIEDRELPPRQRHSHKAKSDPPVIVPLPDLPRFPKLRVFHPDHSLGGIFAGLLNFTPAYARRMIEMGRREMGAQLDHFKAY